MKTLYLIGGTMGVGKTTVCRELQRKLPNCVFLDGDWCWDMRPFTVNDETKAMVMDNICHLLSNFLQCTALENVIFCWVMHEQRILENILCRLDTGACRVVPVSLVCTEEALCTRLEKDIAAGIRSEDMIQRSIPRLPLYERLSTIKVDTTDLTAAQTAAIITKL